jgi:diketogulonate reductase-like aldo/keto reductase
VEFGGLRGGDGAQTDQVLHNLARRGIEWDLLSECQRSGLPIIAYSPFDHAGAVLRHPALVTVARRHEATAAQVALAWVIRHGVVSSIPKASSPEHASENRGALGIALTPEDHADLDRAFPPPRGPIPLEVI